MTIVTFEFQSSPAYKGGRFVANDTPDSPALVMFQSSPAYKGGRFRERINASIPTRVSILARL